MDLLTRGDREGDNRPVSQGADVLQVSTRSTEHASRYVLQSSPVLLCVSGCASRGGLVVYWWCCQQLVSCCKAASGLCAGSCIRFHHVPKGAVSIVAPGVGSYCTASYLCGTCVLHEYTDRPNTACLEWYLSWLPGKIVRPPITASPQWRDVGGGRVCWASLWRVNFRTPGGPHA
jgi:hypothetical protein